MMTSNDHEIDALMRLALSGDARAYADCLALLVPRMRAMARRDLPPGLTHAVEDIVQEGLLAIHIKRASWDPARPLLPWVRVIMRHKAIDMLRGRRFREIHVPIEEQTDLGAPVCDPLAGLHIEQALARLSDRDSALVRGHALEGLDPEVLSKTFDLTPGALRVALHRALKRLAKLARKDEEWKPTN